MNHKEVCRWASENCGPCCSCPDRTNQISYLLAQIADTEETLSTMFHETDDASHTRSWLATFKAALSLFDKGEKQ